MLAISKGYANREQIDQAFLIQKRMLAETQNLLFLGDILVKMGVMTEAQKTTLLSSQSEQRQRSLGKDSPVETAPAHADRPRAAASFKLTISDDSMQAFISWPDGLPSEIKPEAIKEVLTKKGISYGIVNDASIVEHLRTENPSAEPFEVASGRAPEVQNDYDVEYHFDDRAAAIMTFDVNGRQIVGPGAILAEKVPGVKGSAGIDIYSRPVEAPKIPGQPLSCGPGTRWSDDRLQIIASRDGLPEVAGQGCVQVLPCTLIETDVGADQGDIAFDGHLAIRGSVQGGIRIKAKSLLVREVFESNIDIGGEMIVQGGISDARVKIGKKLSAKHINKSHIEALGDIIVENEVRNATVFTKGLFLLEKGRILSSVVTAKKGVRALEIGSDVTKSCQMNVGIDFWVEKEIQKIQSDIENTRELVANLDSRIEQLEATNTAKDEEISRHAQMEAPLQSQRVDLKQQIEKFRAGGDEDKEKITIEALAQVDATLAKMNADVEKLFVDQEKIVDQINAYQNLVQARQEEVEDLHDRIKQLSTESLQDKGVARIDALGAISANTVICSPRAQQTLAESYRRVRLEEIRGSGSGSSTQWIIGVSHL